MAKKSFKDSIQGADKLFSMNDPIETETQTATEQATQNMAEENPEINILDNIKTDTLDNILVNIKEEQKGKNYTFYLSSEVAAAITLIAKNNNISNSKLVDNILKQVLL
jgi:nicotinate-nucleotide pyrophosphorylase